MPKRFSSVRVLLLLVLVLTFSFAVFYYFYPKGGSPLKEVKKETNKTFTIGVLSQKSSKTYETSLGIMKEELSKKGYKINYLQDDVKDTSEFTALAQQYVEKGVDLFVTNSTPATKAAMAATKTIPIVYGSVGDPVLNGLAASLDSSGNNSTGVSSMSVALTPRRLSILKKYLPGLSRVYFIYQPGEISSDNSHSLALKEAAGLGITLVEKVGSNSSDLKRIGKEMKGSEAGAILMAASGMIWSGVDSFIETQNREKIPLIGVDRTMAERGAVISYGPDYRVVGKQMAGLVDQVLQQVKPQYLPIQRPEQIELVVNRDTAAKIIPSQADLLIKSADSLTP